MEVYGENIQMEHVKLVYDGFEYAVTTNTGTLKVRSTTGNESYGQRRRASGPDSPRGEARRFG